MFQLTSLITVWNILLTSSKCHNFQRTMTRTKIQNLLKSKSFNLFMVFNQLTKLLSFSTFSDTLLKFSMPKFLGGVFTLPEALFWLCHALQIMQSNTTIILCYMISKSCTPSHGEKDMSYLSLQSHAILANQLAGHWYLCFCKKKKTGARLQIFHS